jgi:hypothetical protein
MSAHDRKVGGGCSRWMELEITDGAFVALVEAMTERGFP